VHDDRIGREDARFSRWNEERGQRAAYAARTAAIIAAAPQVERPRGGFPPVGPGLNDRAYNDRAYLDAQARQAQAEADAPRFAGQQRSADETARRQLAEQRRLADEAAQAQRRGDLARAQQLREQQRLAVEAQNRQAVEQKRQAQLAAEAQRRAE